MFILSSIKNKNPNTFNNMVMIEFPDKLRLTSELESVTHGKNLVQILNVMQLYDTEKIKHEGHRHFNLDRLVFTRELQLEGVRIIKMLLKLMKKMNTTFTARDESTYAIETICKISL